LGSIAERGVDGPPVKFDGRILVKLMQFCLSFITMWSQNGSFQTPQSCRFSIGLCSDAHLRPKSILGNDRKNVNSGGSTKDGMFAQPRGVPMLDGARDKKQVWRHHV